MTSQTHIIFLYCKSLVGEQPERPWTLWLLVTEFGDPERILEEELHQQRGRTEAQALKGLPSLMPQVWESLKAPSIPPPLTLCLY